MPVAGATTALDFEATRVCDGLGFGDGNISYEDRREELGEETILKIDKAIHSSEILVPVGTDENGNMLDDDGCGDGRNVHRVFEGIKERMRSLARPKVFGGGATMAAATLIGLGSAKGKSLRQTFSDGIAKMCERMIGFGAHTDTHAHGPNCGCGAIDKAPEIIKNSVKYKDKIRSTIEMLGLDTTGLYEVELEYADFAGAMQADDYSGADVMGEIVDNGRVVKELDDNHKEVVIVLGMVGGYVINQELIREVSGGKAQAFAVAIWRVKQIADRLYANESEVVRHKAFLSELVYTLATASVLTKGDLPVYVVKQKD